MSFSRRTVNPSVGSTAWISVWQNAILKACLYNLCRPNGQINLDSTRFTPDVRTQVGKQVREILNQSSYVVPKAVFSFYAETLHRLEEAPSALIQEIRHENQTLRPFLMLSDKPIYVFMDNLDSYYESNPGLWFDSMYGLVRAIYEIRLDLRNVHIYATLRKDIFSQFETEHRTQLLDFVVELRYSDDELREIFKIGILNLHPNLLEFPKLQQSEPLQAFFGDHRWIRARLVDSHDAISELILRYSLRRPRDMVTIGNLLLQAKGNSRMTVDIIRTGLDEAADEICRQYLMELTPQLPAGFSIPDFLKEYVRKNVITAEGVLGYSEAFANSDIGQQCANLRGQNGEYNPFSMLYTTGLLGRLRQEDDAEKQTFLRPGESLLKVRSSDLPPSDRYVLHPILNHLLGDRAIDRKQATGYNCKMLAKRA